MKPLGTFLCLFLLIGPSAVSTAAFADGVPWQSLDREERDALQGYRKDWDRYPQEKRERLRKGAQRYLDLDPQQRRKVRKKHSEYKKLSPGERKRLREEYERRGRGRGR